jgi:MerR family transcriptional regulator, copper efflux regulator
MNISEVSDQTGLPAKTIRYYEVIGLVVPGRSSNGYRDFSEGDLHKLGFLRRARALGFTIAECRQLLALWEDDGRASADVKRIAEAHLGRIDAKIAELASLRSTLTQLVCSCRGDSRPDCPILAGLEAPG